MNQKKAKALRKVISLAVPAELKETRYKVLRASTTSHRQFVLADCWRYRYQQLKKKYG